MLTSWPALLAWVHDVLNGMASPATIAIVLALSTLLLEDVAIAAGVALANGIPPEWGLGFAGILCLLGIQCSLASSRMRIVSSMVAGAAAVAAYALPLKLNMITMVKSNEINVSGLIFGITC